MEELKIIEPSRRLAPRMHVLKPGQALMFGGMAWLELLDCEDASEKATCGCPNNALVSRPRAPRR